MQTPIDPPIHQNPESVGSIQRVERPWRRACGSRQAIPDLCPTEAFPPPCQMRASFEFPTPKPLCFRHVRVGKSRYRGVANMAVQLGRNTKFIVSVQGAAIQPGGSTWGQTGSSRGLSKAGPSWIPSSSKPLGDPAHRREDTHDPRPDPQATSRQTTSPPPEFACSTCFRSERQDSHFVAKSGIGSPQHRRPWLRLGPGVCIWGQAAGSL